MALVAARVPRDLDGAVEHAHLALRCDEREGLADERVRDRVRVPVEAQVGLLAARNRHHEVRLEWVRGKRQQHRALLDERDPDEALLGVAWDDTRVRHLFDPGGELTIEIDERGEAARSEEGVPQILDGPLDLSLLVAAVGGARTRREVVMPRE